MRNAATSFWPACYERDSTPDKAESPTPVAPCLLSADARLSAPPPDYCAVYLRRRLPRADAFDCQRCRCAAIITRDAAAASAFVAAYCFRCRRRRTPHADVPSRRAASEERVLPPPSDAPRGWCRMPFRRRCHFVFHATEGEHLPMFLPEVSFRHDVTPAPLHAARQTLCRCARATASAPTRLHVRQPPPSRARTVFAGKACRAARRQRFIQASFFRSVFHAAL